MRPLLLYTFLFFCTCSYGQDTSKYIVSLKFENLINAKKIQIIDSIYILDVNNSTNKILENIRIVDGIAQIKDFSKGEYKFEFRSKDFTTPNYPILICSKCQNRLTVFIYPKSENKNPWLFNSMQIWPHYKDRSIDLRNDFFSKLTNSEKEILSNFSKTFSIDFIVLRSGEITDVQINDTNKIPENIKSIILKGLDGLKNWETAIVNGQHTDGTYSLKRKILFED